MTTLSQTISDQEVKNIIRKVDNLVEQTERTKDELLAGATEGIFSDKHVAKALVAIQGDVASVADLLRQIVGPADGR